MYTYTCVYCQQLRQVLLYHVYVLHCQPYNVLSKLYHCSQKLRFTESNGLKLVKGAFPELKVQNLGQNYRSHFNNSRCNNQRD